MILLQNSFFFFLSLDLFTRILILNSIIDESFLNNCQNFAYGFISGFLSIQIPLTENEQGLFFKGFEGNNKCETSAMRLMFPNIVHN